MTRALRAVIGLGFLAMGCARAGAPGPGGGGGAGDEGGGGGNGGGFQPIGGGFVFTDAGLPPGNDPGPEPVKLPDPEWNCGDGCYRAPSIAEAAATKVVGGGAGATTGGPTIAYPLEGSLHPMNLPLVTIQWKKAAGEELARVRIAGAGNAHWDFVVPCVQADLASHLAEGECAATLPTGAWLAIGNAARGKDVTITVTSARGDGSAVASSEPRTIAFSPNAVQGGLYYWSTALQGTYRLPFGASKAAPFITPQSATNRFECGGCHAVSRDGRVIAFAAEQAGYLTASLTEDPSKKLIDPPATPKPTGHVMTLSPDGSKVLASWGQNYDNGHIAVYETAKGTKIADLDPAVLGLPEKRVYFPEWSPKGDEIVATVASQDERPWSVNNGYLVVFPYNDGKFGKARVVVPKDAGMFHYYPSWSPDGRWIVFTSAPIKVKSYDNPDSRLRLVSVDGGTVYDLAKATHVLGRTSTWPKFAPFMQDGGNLMFITFNSKVDYGHLLKNLQLPEGGHPQLWMAAIDLRKIAGGDPSRPPVWLPFQDLDQRNHLGYWTERVACSNAAGGGCGEFEVCENGKCVVRFVE